MPVVGKTEVTMGSRVSLELHDCGLAPWQGSGWCGGGTSGGGRSYKEMLGEPKHLSAV